MFREGGAKSHRGKLSQAYIQHTRWRKLLAEVITSRYFTSDCARKTAILFLAEEPRKQLGLNFRFLQRRIAQGRYFDITPTLTNINGMFLLLLIGTNIRNRWINFLIKSQKRVDLYLPF